MENARQGLWLHLIARQGGSQCYVTKEESPLDLLCRVRGGGGFKKKTNALTLPPPMFLQGEIAPGKKHPNPEI